VIGIIFAIGCRSPFRKGFSLRGQSQLTPSRFLHNRIYVTCFLYFAPSFPRGFCRMDSRQGGPNDLPRGRM